MWYEVVQDLLQIISAWAEWHILFGSDANPHEKRLTPTISAPRHPTKPENTKALRGAGAMDRVVRPVYLLVVEVGVRSSPQPTAYSVAFE